MASWFTRALDRITPWDRGGEVQRRQERKKREEEQHLNTPRQTPTPTPPQTQQPTNRFNSGRTLGGQQFNIGITQPNNNITVPRKSEYEYESETPKPKQSFWNKVRDQFDANTEADQWRRQQGNRLRGDNKPIIIENPGNIGTAVRDFGVGAVKGVGRGIRAVTTTPIEAGRSSLAQITGNKEAERMAEYRMNVNLFGREAADKMARGDGLSVGDAVGGAMDVISVLPAVAGARFATSAARAGLAQGGRQGLRTSGRGILRGADDAFLGVRDARNLGRGAYRRVRGRGATPAAAAVPSGIDDLDDAAIAASAEAAIQATRPRPITVAQNIPVDIAESTPQPINVRDLNPDKPLIREIAGDARTANEAAARLEQAAQQARETAFNTNIRDARPDRSIDGITPQQPEAPYQLDPKVATNAQDKIIDDYAAWLKDMGEGNGVDLIPDGEAYGFGKKRVSNNVRFGDTGGKRMTKAMWRDEAERQLRAGRADPAIQQAFNDAADPEVQSMLARGERPDVPEGKPIKVGEEKDIEVVDRTDAPANLPETPGTVRVTTQADPQAIKTQAAAEQPPVIPRNSKGERLTPVSQEVEVPRVNSDSTSPIESLEMPTSGDVAPNTTYNRIIADETVPKEVKNSIYNMTHEVHSDQKLIKSANELVNSDTKLAQELFDGRHFANQGKVDSHVHLGNSLIEQYNKIGDTDMAGLVYDELIRSATQTGQGLRAFQSISKISPQGIVRYAERIADEAGKPLSDELRGKLVKAAKDIAKMEPGEMKSDAIQNMIQMARQPDSWSKAGDIFKSIISTPRAIMASSDLSFGGRQGAVLGARYPKEWAEAQAKSAKYAVSEKAFKDGMKELANLTDSNGESLYSTFKAMGLDMPAVFGESEEVFGKTNLIESKAAKKAGVGHVVAGSDRAFSGAAAELRANVAKKIIDGYGGVKGIQNWTKKDLTDLGKVINTATGRGSGKKGGWFEKAAPALGDTLFSARLWKSRLDLLNPVYYARLSPAARKVALQSSGAFSAVVSATLAAAAMAGADIETDPRSSDFGKIKVGNNRYDVMGGLQQNIVLAARQITGEKKNSTTGEITRLDTAGYGKPTRLSVLGDTLQNKLSPVLGVGTTLLEGKDRGGQPIQNPWGEIAKLFIPLGAAGTYETIKDESERAGGVSASTIAKGIAKSAPGFFGVGVQTYGPTNPKEIASNDVLKQLNKEGISIKQKDIDGYISNGEYDKARRASEYNLQKLEADEESSENDKQNARNKIRDLGYQERGIPSSSDGILKAFENNDWDKMIEGNRWALERAADDGEISQRTKDKYEREIRKAETLRDNNLSSADWEEYDSIDVAEWRKLADTDPEAYNRLWQIDQLMASNNVSDARGKPDKQKYSIKKSKSGSGRGGSRKYSTEFGKITGSGSNPINVRSYASMLEQARSGNTTPLIKRTRPNIVHRIGTRGYN